MVDLAVLNLGIDPWGVTKIVGTWKRGGVTLDSRDAERSHTVLAVLGQPD